MVKKIIKRNKDKSEPILVNNRDDAWLNVCIVIFQKFKNKVSDEQIIDNAQQIKNNIETLFYKLLTQHLIFSGKTILRDEKEKSTSESLIARHNVMDRENGIAFSNYNFTAEITNVDEHLENTLRIYPKDYYSLEWYCQDAPVLFALEKTLLGETVNAGKINLSPAVLIPYYLHEKPAILIRHKYLEISFEIEDYAKFIPSRDKLFKKAFGSTFRELLIHLAQESSAKNDRNTKKWVNDVEIILKNAKQ